MRSLFLCICILLTSLLGASGQVSCSEDSTCERLLFVGSKCVQGQCSNPFEKGCLHTLLNHEQDTNMDNNLPEWVHRLQTEPRACNSEDEDSSAGVVCTNYQEQGNNIYEDYTEVRILSQNWESSFFASWILQILLSEVLRVPTTVETGTASAQLNFYSPTNDFGYGEYNDFGALDTANQLPQADCRLLPKSHNYTSCGHVIPEYWTGDLQELFVKQREGLIDTPEALGAIGQQGLFVTKFTAEADPTLLHLLGIAGEVNRKKLAETFLRPTTWKDYCQLVSSNNCTEPDGVAQRAPQDATEEERMFVEGEYTGYFRATEENDCELHPDTCTGHVADFPCGWVSFIKPQMYWHNIALQSSGSEPGSQGYTYSQLVEMYAAANATKSNLMTMWWTPEAVYSTYLGTPAEMQRVVLPTPTQECVENRIESTKRCHYQDVMEQYGNPAGACDEAPQLLQKVIASGLYDPSSVGSAKQSPAYEAIKAFKISDLEFGNILQHWINRGVDTYGFDPRLATCLWVRKNLHTVQDFIPRSHPRVAVEDNRLEYPLFYVAVSFGGLATLLTLTTTLLTYRRRKGYVMRFSQVEFLFLLLFGILLVSVGSLLLATEPTNASCLATAWLLSLGYTLELVPLIVKVGAMNRLMTAAKRMKRIVLTQRQLFGTVALFCSIIVVFLILWSALDAPQRQGEFTLTDETTHGESIVTINYYCASNSDVWRYMAVLWHCLLLLCATVLAFQTRNLQAGFSESSVLAIMIYSHFVFVLLRAISFVLEGTVSESYMAGLRSLIYSTDAIVTLCVYFIPKLCTDDRKFYDLTHTAAGKSQTDGRGSVNTVSDRKSRTTGSNLCSPLVASSMSKPLDAAKKQEEGEDDSSETSEMLPTQPQESRVSGVASISKQSNNDNVLKDSKVSWGGACMTMIIGDDSDDENDQTMAAAAPFEKPVDVLKDGKDSWAGAHMTMMIHDDDDYDEEANKLQGSERIAPISEDSASAAPTAKSLLLPASLPKKAPTRFDYAASRITRMREVHNSEVETDKDTFNDESY